MFYRVGFVKQNLKVLIGLSVVRLKLRVIQFINHSNPNLTFNTVQNEVFMTRTLCTEPRTVSSKDFKYQHSIHIFRQKLNWSQGNSDLFLQDSPILRDLQGGSSSDSKNLFYQKEDSFLPLTSTFTELYCNSK